MHAGVRRNLAAVQRHIPELHQPCRLAQLEHLDEQIAQSLQVAAPELGDGAEIWLVLKDAKALLDQLT